MRKWRRIVGKARGVGPERRQGDTMDDLGAPDDNRITLLEPFPHKEPRDDDDCGLPKHPIYSNYSKYLWTSHTRTGGVEIPQVSEAE